MADNYDPRLDMYLCPGCWNNQNWSHHCSLGHCECPKRGCNGYRKPPEPAKFSRKALVEAGQTSIMDGELGEPIQISPKS